MSANMKVHILDLGSMGSDFNALVAMYTRATAQDKSPTCKYVTFPVWGLYIEHPQAKIIFDTGLRADALDGGEPPEKLLNFPIYRTEEQSMEHQLELCGVKPEEIDYVIVSHLHHDHAGRLDLFKNAKVVVQKTELMNALWSTHVVDPMGTYLRADLEYDHLKWMPIDGEYDLLDGIKLIPAPGHVDGLQCMMLSLANNGNMLITSDASYTSINWGPVPRPAGALADSKAYFATMAKLHKLADETKATVIFGHDRAQFDSLKHAPEYYD